MTVSIQLIVLTVSHLMADDSPSIRCKAITFCPQLLTSEITQQSTVVCFEWINVTKQGSDGKSLRWQSVKQVWQLPDKSLSSQSDLLRTQSNKSTPKLWRRRCLLTIFVKLCFEILWWSDYNTLKETKNSPASASSRAVIISCVTWQIVF